MADKFVNDVANEVAKNLVASFITGGHEQSTMGTIKHIAKGAKALDNLKKCAIRKLLEHKS